MNVLIFFVLWDVMVFTIIYVHEYGHYWAARWGGVSGANVRVRMFFLPPHVVLRTAEGTWARPWQQPLYGQLCGQYFHGNRSRNLIYVGAGLVVQSLFAWLGTWTLFAAGFGFWAVAFLMISVSITTVYFFLELGMFIVRKKAFGDFSVLWTLSKRAFSLVMAGVIVFHTMAFLIFCTGH